MAGPTLSRKRLWNPELIIDVNGVLPNKLKQNIDGSNKTAYELTWSGASQASEEMGTAAASAKDGTAIPYQVIVVSSDVADKRDTAAGAVHSVALIGVTTNSIPGYVAWQADPNSAAGKLGKPVSTVEVVAMNGTADVTATRWYLWTDGMYSVEWGTGATDATGNISAEAPANTELLKITAATNESSGGRFHFPQGKSVRMHHVDITPLEALAAASGIIVDLAWTGVNQTNNTDPDLGIEYYTYITSSNSATFDREHVSKTTTLNTQVILGETTVTASKNFFINVLIESS